MEKRLPYPVGRNHLLQSLSADDRARLDVHLEPVEMAMGMVLEMPGEKITRVYFPETGLGSMIAVGREGHRIEAGLFGFDGMSGTPVLTGGTQSPHETFMQIGGHGRAIATERLSELLDESASMRQHLLRFLQALFIQATHTALSNGRARLEERLARWLLMCHDRIEGDTMVLTHEFLSVMLGVRRAGVTVGTHQLEGKGLIRAGRGRITVLDREGLEHEARHCYGVPEDEYERLYPPVVSGRSITKTAPSPGAT